MPKHSGMANTKFIALLL